MNHVPKMNVVFTKQSTQTENAFSVACKSNAIQQDLEEGGRSPTTTGLLASGLLFIQQNIVQSSCSPNFAVDVSGQQIINTQFNMCMQSSPGV